MNIIIHFEFFVAGNVAGYLARRLKTTLQNGFILFYTVLMGIKKNYSLCIIRKSRSSI